MDYTIGSHFCNELLSLDVTHSLSHLLPRYFAFLTDVQGHPGRQNQRLCSLIPTPLNTKKSSLKGKNGEILKSIFNFELLCLHAFCYSYLTAQWDK